MRVSICHSSGLLRRLEQESGDDLIPCESCDKAFPVASFEAHQVWLVSNLCITLICLSLFQKECRIKQNLALFAPVGCLPSICDRLFFRLNRYRMERHPISRPLGKQQYRIFPNLSCSLAHPNTSSLRKNSRKVWSSIPSWRSIVSRIDVGRKADSFLLITGEFQVGIDSTMRTKKTSSKDTAEAQNNGCFTVSKAASFCGFHGELKSRM